MVIFQVCLFVIGIFSTMATAWGPPPSCLPACGSWPNCYARCPGGQCCEVGTCCGTTNCCAQGNTCCDDGNCCGAGSCTTCVGGHCVSTCIGCKECIGGGKCRDQSMKCSGCEICVGGVCEDDDSKCSSGEICCEGGCYATNTYKCCKDHHPFHHCYIEYECCGESGCCNPNICQTCVGGVCKVCGGDTCKCCINGQCVEPRCDNCHSINATVDECEHTPQDIYCQINGCIEDVLDTATCDYKGDNWPCGKSKCHTVPVTPHLPAIIQYVRIPSDCPGGGLINYIPWITTYWGTCTSCGVQQAYWIACQTYGCVGPLDHVNNRYDKLECGEVCNCN